MNFLKNILASIIGVFIALFVIILVLFIIIESASREPEPYIEKNSVMTIDLTGNIPDRTTENPFQDIFNKYQKDQVSLAGLSANLKKATKDKRIRGILLKTEFLSAPWSTLEDVHNMLLDFRKKTGKFIYSTTDDIGYNEKSYYVATAADSIFSPPQSFFEFDGFYIETPFFKGLFDKLGIQPEISRYGKYKSAVEPFIRKDYSEPNKVQLKAILDNISNTYLSAASKYSGKSIEQLNAMLNESPHISAGYAGKEGLINALYYSNQVDSVIKKRIGLKESDKLHLVSYTRYNKVSDKSAGIDEKTYDNKIAVIYAEGEIVPDITDNSPFNENQYITYSSFKKSLDKVLENKKVKALVVRVNSPGGSGSSSDLIWHLIRKARQKMPVITSMGPLAASGGYYISMAADTIVAMPSTLTGSIGVFGTKFNVQKLFNDKLGITFDVVKSNKNADWLLPTKPFSATEQKAFQGFIDDFYHTFITKVSECRHIPVAQVDSIGQGRVWVGTDAIKHHLVDVMGDLHTAINIAAKKAGVTEYNVITYPARKNIFDVLMGSTQNQVYDWIHPGINFNMISIRKIRKYLQENPRQIEALLPVEINVE